MRTNILGLVSIVSICFCAKAIATDISYPDFSNLAGLVLNNDVTSWSFTNGAPTSPGSGGGAFDVITFALLGVWFVFNVLNGKIEQSSGMNNHARMHP